MTSHDPEESRVSSRRVRPRPGGNRKVGALAPDFHLALGDLSYDTTGSEQAWCDLVTERVGNGFPFELLSGNHEANGQNGNPSCVVDSDADLVRGAGTVFDTVGTGGVQTVPVDTTQPDYPYFAVTNGTGNATDGVLEVSLTESSLSAGFQRASGGTFGDSFKINGGPSAPNPIVLASHDFGRTLASGWGAADEGGTRTVKGSASAASVAAAWSSAAGSLLCEHLGGADSPHQ